MTTFHNGKVVDFFSAFPGILQKSQMIYYVIFSAGAYYLSIYTTLIETQGIW